VPAMDPNDLSALVLGRPAARWQRFRRAALSARPPHRCARSPRAMSTARRKRCTCDRAAADSGWSDGRETVTLFTLGAAAGVVALGYYQSASDRGCQGIRYIASTGAGGLPYLAASRRARPSSGGDPGREPDARSCSGLGTAFGDVWSLAALTPLRRHLSQAALLRILDSMRQYDAIQSGRRGSGA